MTEPMSKEKMSQYFDNIEEDMTGQEARAYIMALGLCVKEVADMLRLSVRSVNENLDRPVVRHKFKLSLLYLKNVARET